MVAIYLGPLVLIFAAVLLGRIAILTADGNPPGTALFSLFLLVTGTAMFAGAKLSVLRAGHRLSFGWRHMSSFGRRLYVMGYALMALGVALAIGVLVVANR
jgi:hypothetical protein